MMRCGNGNMRCDGTSCCWTLEEQDAPKRPGVVCKLNKHVINTILLEQK